MDTPGGLNEENADKALRDLFAEMGPLSAPEGLEVRIFQQISVTAQPSIERPLLPRWAWYLSAALFASLLFLPLGGTTSWSNWTHWIPEFSLGSALASRWLIMGLVAAAALLGLNAWLDRHRSSDKAF